MKKYGLVVGVVAAVIIILAVAYTFPLSQPSAKPRQLGLTADNFFKIRVGEDAPFFAAGRGGIKPYQFTWDFGGRLAVAAAKRHARVFRRGDVPRQVDDKGLGRGHGASLAHCGRLPCKRQLYPA